MPKKSDQVPTSSKSTNQPKKKKNLTRVSNLRPKKKKEEHTDEIDETRVRHQCRPALVHKLALSLNQRRDKTQILSFFQRTGFAGILKISHWTGGIPTSFVNWLLQNFDAEHLQLRLTATTVLKLENEDVNRVYGLPCGGYEVDTSSCTQDAIEAMKMELRIMDGSTAKTVSEKTILKALGKTTNTKKWAKLAILYILGTLLCPRNHPEISLAYAEILQDITKVSDFNWSRHVLQYMKSGIKAPGAKGSKSPTADFHFMMVNTFLL